MICHAEGGPPAPREAVPREAPRRGVPRAGLEARGRGADALPPDAHRLREPAGRHALMVSLDGLMVTI